MSNGNDVDKMTPAQKLTYVQLYLEDMIAENAISDPQLSAGLAVLKEQLSEPQPKVDVNKAVDTLAKNLPNVSKGIIAAKDAFLKGDNITGAAEIMNICAAVAPIIGAFTATGGPAGMLVGALFSVIGQIIAMFQPAKESDVDKIKTFLLSIEAEGIREKADANLVSIRLAAKGIRNQADEAKKALKWFNGLQVLPLVTESIAGIIETTTGGAVDLAPWKAAMAAKYFNHQDALNFEATLQKEKITIADFKIIDGPTVLQHWGVASWLQKEDRQDQDEWPEILGMFCQAWADLLTAYITLIAFANSADMEVAFAYVAPSNKQKWTYEGGDDDRKQIEKHLLKLKVYASKRLDDVRDCNQTMSAILEKLTPVARRRGVFVARNSWDILPGTGKQPKWGGSFWASCSRFLITPPNEGLTSPTAQYHLWLLDTRGPQVGHERIDSQKRTPVSNTNSYIGSAAGVSDICVLPSPEDTNGNFVYCAHEQGSTGYVQLFKRGAKGDMEIPGQGWAPATKAPVFQIRAVTPRATLSDDPDKDAMPKLLLQGANHYNSIFYGALRSSSEIYVDRCNERCYVPSPWGSYTGIAVDPYYLWVFGTGGFACTTHASVMRCISDQAKDTNSKPRWLMGPSIDQLLWDGPQYFDSNEAKSWPPTKGLVDLSPCDDGTLFISLTTRKVTKKTVPYDRNYYYKADTNAIYTAIYHIDVKNKILSVEPWEKLAGGEETQQVQKMPIYCWPLFARLKEACVSPEWQPKTLATSR